MWASRTPLSLFAAGLLWAQDPLQILPDNYRLVFQNDFLRVLHVHYVPLEKLPIHDHSAKPTVYVYLSDSGPVRFTHVESPSFSLVRRPLNAGAFRFSPGRLEKHEVENLGNIPSDFLRVELARLPLGYHGDAFRSPKSFDAVHTGVRTELDTPLLKIERVVVAPGQTANLPASDAGALLIAFSASAVQSPNTPGAPRTLRSGDVLWVNPYRDLQVTSAEAGAPGHLLRIALEPKP